MSTNTDSSLPVETVITQGGSDNESNSPSTSDVDSPTPNPAAPKRKAGRRKINIEFIEEKSRRHITFSKRKAGIMKKAYELSTLTGTQVLLLVASETGHVYTFATPKLQPLITKPEGKNLIQACLNSDASQPAPQEPPMVNAQMPSYADNLPYNMDNTYAQEEKKPNPNYLHHQVDDSLGPGGYNPSQQAAYSQPASYGNPLAYQLNPVGYPSPPHRPQTYAPSVSNVGPGGPPSFFPSMGYVMNNYSNIPPYPGKPNPHLGQHDPN